MNAIILAAGLGRRMQPAGWDLPKCLLPCPEGTLLDNALAALGAGGITRVAIVVGHEQEQVIAAARRHPLAFEFIHNPDFAKTNTLYSLFLARDFLREGALCLNGDVWFRRSALDSLQLLCDARLPHPPLPKGEKGGSSRRAKTEISQEALLGDDQCGRLQQRAAIDGALLVVRGQCGDEEVKVIADSDGRVEWIGKEIDPRLAVGEFIGVARFGPRAGDALAESLESCEAAGAANLFYEHSLNQLLDRLILQAVFIPSSEVTEIDTPDDYEAAKRLWDSIRVRK